MGYEESHRFISFKKSWTLDGDTWFLLGQCKSLIAAISRTPLLPRYRKEIYQVNLVKGVQATTAIEGNTLSVEEISKIEQGESLGRDSKRYMEQEVKNVIEALNSLSDEIIRGNQTFILTPDRIKQFHKMIGKDLGDHLEAIPGQFRNNEVTVGKNYRAPSFIYVDMLVEKFCDWIRKEFHFEKGQIFLLQLFKQLCVTSILHGFTRLATGMVELPVSLNFICS